MKKGLFTRIITIALLFSVFLAIMIPVSAASTYKINGVNVSYNDFASSPNECWVYANNFYNKIWGQKFNNKFDDSSNSLRNLSDSQLTLTEEHLKAYVSNAALGSCLRICNKEYLHGSDGSGHSQIIVQKDSKGFTVFEGGLSSSPYCREKYYTWSEYIKTSWLGGQYDYIKYIKWPSAPKYSSLIKETYPSYCAIKATADTSVMTMPCSGYTDASSKQVKGVKKGETFTSIELILNSQGNHWYKVQLSDGKTGYVPSSRMQFVELLTSDLKISGVKAPTSLKKGNVFVIEGKISTTYNNIKKVYAYVYEGVAPELPASAVKATGGEATVNGKSYSLKGSTVDNKVEFNKLAVTPDGHYGYDYAIYVTVECYYAKDEKTATSVTSTHLLHTSNFKVTNTTTSCSHSYSSKVTTAATCAQNGVKTYTCSKCKHSYTEAIKATGDHSYTSKVTTEATCGQQGVMTYTCKTCSKTYTESIPITGEHDYLETVIPANCTQMGQWYMECKNCGKSAEGHIPATGEHDYTGKVTTQAACTSAGVRTYTCVDCGKSYTEAIPATGHDYKNGACTRCKQKDPNAVSTKNTKITVESKTVSSGSTVVLEVKIENNPGFSYLKLAAAFDSAVFEFVGATNGTVSTEDFEVSGKNILWSTDADSKEEGLLVTLTFHVKKDVKQGDYAIGVRPVECFNEEEAVVPLTVLNGVVSITDILYGDVNGDGDVNGRDMIRLKKYLANYDDETGVSTVEIFGGADCNGDNQVNGRDLIRLKKYLANYDDETGSSTVVLGP